jgi:MraZ protein
MYPSRLDDKGRMKLPAAFQQYVSSLADKRLFVTSLDRTIAQIYPIEAWRENERLFQANRTNLKLFKAISFNAADLGAEAEMDSQGRITFPPELRRELKLEEQTLRLYAYKGRIEVLSEKIYEARKQDAMQVGPDQIDEAEAQGLI